MKEKFLSLATKPMKKVAEARARKRKRAGQKLKAAKKQVCISSAITLMNRSMLCLYYNATRFAAGFETRHYVQHLSYSTAFQSSCLCSSVTAVTYHC
jgi:Spb1 C-terminal domain